jgi:hypothetical protein
MPRGSWRGFLLPIATLTNTHRDTIGKLTQQLTETANQRYQVRRKTAYHIQNDLSTPQARLNQRLEVW